MVLCPSRLCELTTHVWWEGTFILASDNQHHAKHRCNPAAGNTEKSLCLPHNVTQWKTDCWNLKEGEKKPLIMVKKKKKDGQPNVLKWHFNYTRLFWALFSENISRLLWTVLSHGWQRFCDGQTLSFNSHRVQASDEDWSMEPARTWCLPTLTFPLASRSLHCRCELPLRPQHQLTDCEAHEGGSGGCSVESLPDEPAPGLPHPWLWQTGIYWSPRIPLW